MSVELPEVIAAYKERCGVTLENARKASRMKTKGSIFVRGTWFKYGATTHFDAQRFRYRWDAKVRIACGGIVSVHATDMHREYYGYGKHNLLQAKYTPVYLVLTFEYVYRWIKALWFDTIW